MLYHPIIGISHMNIEDTLWQTILSADHTPKNLHQDPTARDDYNLYQKQYYDDVSKISLFISLHAPNDQHIIFIQHTIPRSWHIYLRPSNRPIQQIGTLQLCHRALLGLPLPDQWRYLQQCAALYQHPDWVNEHTRLRQTLHHIRNQYPLNDIRINRLYDSLYTHHATNKTTLYDQGNPYHTGKLTLDPIPPITTAPASQHEYISAIRYAQKYRLAAILDRLNSPT